MNKSSDQQISGRQIALVAIATAAVVTATIGYVLFSAAQSRSDIASRMETAEARLAEFQQEERMRAAQERAANPPEIIPFAEEWGTGNAVMEPGEVAFVNRVPGPDYGRVGIVNAQGERRLLDDDITCERMHVAGALMVCLHGPGPAGTYATFVYDFREKPGAVIRSKGASLPSRARINVSSGWTTTTEFLSGSSYQDVGGFETVVYLYNLRPTGETLRLDLFDLAQREPWHSEPETQFWGVTLADDGTFWATGGFGEVIELLTGSIEDETLEPTGIFGSCPSLSPDGSTLVYKRPVDGESMSSGFQLVARDLVTGDEWTINEKRTVDDQVEWLDNDTLLYALHIPGTDPAETVQRELDIWSIDIAPDAEPALFLPQAESPGVLR